MKPETGPIYGVPLIETLPLGEKSGMLQQMPDRDDLQHVRRMSERVVAGYEVLLSHYRNDRNTLDKVFSFANKMSRSGAADRARAGNDILELLDQCGFKETSLP